METSPSTDPSAAGGISVLDTDLEVDFETPVGYVEPARPAPAPVPTMASKLKIDLGETTSNESTRPSSAMGTAGGAGVGAGGSLESFTGMGQSLSGRRTKGKGLAKEVEKVDASSRINRTEYVSPVCFFGFGSWDDMRMPEAANKGVKTLCSVLEEKRLSYRVSPYSHQ